MKNIPLSVLKRNKETQLAWTLLNKFHKLPTQKILSKMPTYCQGDRWGLKRKNDLKDTDLTCMQQFFTLIIFYFDNRLPELTLRQDIKQSEKKIFWAWKIHHLDLRQYQVSSKNYWERSLLQLKKTYFAFIFLVLAE